MSFKTRVSVRIKRFLDSRSSEKFTTFQFSNSHALAQATEPRQGENQTVLLAIPSLGRQHHRPGENHSVHSPISRSGENPRKIQGETLSSSLGILLQLELEENRLKTSVKGKEIILDVKTFSSLCCNIPYHGSIKDFGLACDWDTYDRKEFYYSMCRFSKEEIDLGNLNLEDRLLHYFLSYVIIPKFSNHSQINDMELQLM
ncbi:hypothetical protein Lal_00027111 [Lupinus albus]|nr:hypothetical protein Lal_00027111 [Lupinus albus]